MAFAYVVRAVRDYIQTELGLDIEVRVGWRKAARQLTESGNGNRRVTFVPMPPRATPPVEIGGHSDGAGRTLFDLRFAYEVRLRATADCDDDEAHMAEALGLLELVSQGLQSAYAGNVFWLGGKWADDVKDLRNGAELRMMLEVSMPIRDRSSVIAKPVQPYPREPKPAP